MEECVNVAVRIKPSLEPVETCLETINKNPPVLLLVDKAQTFHFDNIFTSESNQTTIYEETVKPLVDKVKMGYNCTVFAYGQTGTGKTYTMGTNHSVNFASFDQNCGIIPRTLSDFFSTCTNIEISISFIEIYNEKVYDLLNEENNVPLPVKGFKIYGLIKEDVFDVSEALNLLHKGTKNRHTGETKQNTNSSRSHAIFTIYCHNKDDTQNTIAKLNLVDLAGSESVRRTGTCGASFQEGVSINKGLLSLGQVMAALSTKSNHVPYRQSIITTILQDSLNKNNFILLIACISAHSEDAGETQQTLEFASRVKKMKNKPEINHFLTQYKKDHPQLFNRFLTPNKRSNSSVFETPLKRNRPTMPIITETVANRSDSIFSGSLSSIQSEAAAPNFSPVFKKYMAVMEESIINKLEGVIESTLKKSRRRSSRLVQKENKTPNFPWEKVATIVRSEILQLTGRRDRATSSPLTGASPIEALPMPKTKLNYDIDEDDDDIFKIPAPKKQKTRRSTRLMISKEEIDNNDKSVENDDDNMSSGTKLNYSKNDENCLNNKFLEKDEEDIFKIPAQKVVKKQKNAVKRRSTQLMDNGIDNNDKTIEDDDIFKIPAPKIVKRDKTIVGRRSMRLQLKEIDKELNMVPNLQILENHRRKSVRLINKENGNVAATPIKNKENRRCTKCANPRIEKLQKIESNPLDSPITSRTKQVLHILNSGTVKEIEKLHTIGTKTAEKITLFREINGEFRTISDLSNMPNWSKNKYQRFLVENFLRDE